MNELEKGGINTVQKLRNAIIDFNLPIEKNAGNFVCQAIDYAYMKKLLLPDSRLNCSTVQQLINVFLQQTNALGIKNFIRKVIKKEKTVEHSIALIFLQKIKKYSASL